MHPPDTHDAVPGNATRGLRVALAGVLVVTACVAVVGALGAPSPAPDGAQDEASKKADDDFVARFQRAQRLMGSKRDDEAEKLLRQLIDEKPEQATVHHALAVLLQFRKRPDDATAEFVVAAKLAPDDAVIQRDAGLQFLQMGRTAEAETCLARAAKLWPEDSEALVGHGAALRALGRAAEAEAEYRRAVAANPESVDAAVGLAACLVEKNPNEAISLIAKAPGPWPDVLLVRGLSLIRLGRFDDAVKELSKIVSVAPPDLTGRDFLRGAAESLALCGDAKDAGTAAKKWFDVESAAGAPSEAACLCLATTREATGDHVGALAALDAAPAKRSARTRLVRAAVLVRAARKDDAKTALEALAASDKEQFEGAAASRLLGRSTADEFAKRASAPALANDVAWIESLAAEMSGDAVAAASARARAAELSRPRGEFPGLLVPTSAAK